MKREDYNRTLDGIRCSDEFKDKMEKMLSLPEGAVPEGYEDSVSAVERAPKRNWLKTIAAAAAVLVLISGAGTGAYHYLHNMDDELPPDIVTTEHEGETYSTPFGDVSGMMLTISGENGFSLMDAPESMVADIAQVLNENDLVHLEVEKVDGQYEKIEPLWVNCYGENQFALAVYPNGIEFHEDGTENSESQWYSCEDIYTKIQGAVAKNIIYADLSENDVMFDTGATVEMQALDAEKKQRVREVFEKNADKIELNTTSEGYPLLNGSVMTENEIESNGYSAIVFGNYASMLIDSRFAVKFNSDDSFEIFYANVGGVGYSCVFNAPSGFCETILNILRDNGNESLPWEGTSWDEYTSLSFYHDDCYHTYIIGAQNEYRDYLEKLDWVAIGTPNDDFHTPNEFDIYLNDGVLTIDSDGNAYYDKVSGEASVYRFDSSVYTDLFNILKSITGKTFANGGTLPERVRNSWSNNDGNSECSYIINENDSDVFIYFEMDSNTRNRLLEVIESTEWAESGHLNEDDYIHNKVFSVDGFYFDREGFVYDYSDGIPFMAEDVTVDKEIIEILEGALKNDSCAYAQYMLFEPKMKYTSMRCAVLPDSMTYEEASVSDTANMDTETLRNKLLSDLQIINIHSKSCKMTKENEDQSSFILTVELDTARRWDVEFAIDDYGTTLYYRKTESNSETGEQTVIEGYRVENLEYFHDIEG